MGKKHPITPHLVIYDIVVITEPTLKGKAMSKTKKTIAVQFRTVPTNERDPMYNTTHFRFDAYNVKVVKVA